MTTFNRQMVARHKASIQHRQTKPATKTLARMAINNAVRRGHLMKQPCAVCDGPKVEAHHHLGYAREHFLDVAWLCRTHHVEAHKEAP